MSDPNAIRETLSQTGLTSCQQSARVLSEAFKWFHTSLDEVQGDRANTLKGLAELARALSLGVTLLYDIAPVIENSLPGPTLQQALARTAKELEQEAKQVSQLRAAVNNLTEAEQKYQALKAEQEVLENRLADLQRIVDFDEEALNALRQQVKTIENRVVWFDEVKNLEGRIGELAPDLIVMEDTFLSLLQTHTREKMLQAQKTWGEIQAELKRQNDFVAGETIKYKQARQELSAAQERYNEISQEVVRIGATMAEYRKADALVADAISHPSALGARQTLARIEDMLKNVDEMLKHAMAANESAKKVSELRL